MTNPIRDAIETKKEAFARVVGFIERYGLPHYKLACHAAVPLTLTPDLLYQIWAMFTPDVPFVAVSDVLLSSLTRDVGHELYEIGPYTREYLLKDFPSEGGAAHVKAVAQYVFSYVEQTLNAETGIGQRRILGEEVNMYGFIDSERWASYLETLIMQAQAATSETGERDTASALARAAQLHRLADATSAQTNAGQTRRVLSRLPDGVRPPDVSPAGGAVDRPKTLGENTWVLMIAPAYNNTAWALPNEEIATNVRNLAAALQSRLRIPDDHVRILAGAELTKDQILHSINDFLIENPRIQPNAEVFVHIAAHSTRPDEIQKEFVIAPSDLNEIPKYALEAREKLVLFSELVETFDKLVKNRNHNLLVAVDGCNSGLVNEPPVSFTWLSATSEGNVLVLSPGMGRTGTGLFTEFLTSALAELDTGKTYTDLLRSVQKHNHQFYAEHNKKEAPSPQIYGNSDRWAFGLHPFMPLTLEGGEIILRNPSTVLQVGARVDVFAGDVRTPMQLRQAKPLAEAEVSKVISNDVYLNLLGTPTAKITSHCLAVVRTIVNPAHAEKRSTQPNLPTLAMQLQLPRPLVCEKIQKLDVLVQAHQPTNPAPTPARVSKPARKRAVSAYASPEPVLETRTYSLEIACSGGEVAPSRRMLTLAAGESSHEFNFLIKPNQTGAVELTVSLRDSDGLVAQSFFSMQAEAAQQQDLESPRGVALHVGVNALDPEKYDGWEGQQLQGAESDARDMVAITQKNGFTGLTLIGHDATLQAFGEVMSLAAKTLRRKDMLLFSFSGWDAQVLNTDKGKGKGQQGLCLLDGKVMDDDLTDYIAQFTEGARIVAIIDSCYCASMIKEKTTTGKALAASVILLSASQDTQAAMDGEKNGAFTGELIKAWRNGEYRGNYLGLQKAIARKLPDSQEPSYRFIGGQDVELERMQPFSLVGEPYTIEAFWKDSRTQLIELLVKNFDQSDFRTLCFDLDVDYENLSGTGMKEVARELVMYEYQRGMLPALVQAMAKAHPDNSELQELLHLVNSISGSASASRSDSGSVTIGDKGGHYSQAL